MKKALSVLMCACMVIAAFTACNDSGSQSTNDSEASIEVSSQVSSSQDSSLVSEVEVSEVDSIVSAPTELTFIFADGDEGAKEAINNIVDNFNATYSDITINIQPGDGGAYSEFLKTKDSVGEFPDIMEMRDTAMYVRAGKLAPLSDEITSLFMNTMQFDGETYTAPIAGENTDGIFYNKTYFEENNLEIPATWDEFIALCQQIQDLGDMSPLVVGGQDLWHLGFWYSTVYTNDVLMNNPDFIADCYAGKATFNDPAMVQTFEDLVELFQYAQDGWVSTPDAQITTFLVNDNSAMLYSGTHMITSIYEADPDFNLGWFAVPDRDGNYNLVGGAGVGGLSLSAEAAEDPDKVAAFEAFIKFFFAKENYKDYLETLSAMPTTVDSPDIEGTEVYQTILQAVENADYLSPMWNGLSGDNELPPDFRNFTYKTLVEVVQGTRTIESGLDEMQKSWDVAAESFNPVTGVGLDEEETT